MIRPQNPLAAVAIILLGAGVLAAQNSAQAPTSMSAGKAMEEAMKGAAADRVQRDSNPTSKAEADQEAGKAAAADSRTFRAVILTKTGGVDFGPYVRDAMSKVRLKWYAAIPTVQNAKTANGKVVIEFTVRKDGSVALMKLAESSGFTPMDQAAWTAIVSAAPFDPFPMKFTGDDLRLRFRFYYNPNRSDRKEINRARAYLP